MHDHSRIHTRELNSEQTELALARQRDREAHYRRISRVLANTADIFEFLDWTDEASVHDLEAFAHFNYFPHDKTTKH